MVNIFYKAIGLLAGMALLISCNTTVIQDDKGVGEQCTAQQRQEMHEGDIVLRHGSGMLSQWIVEGLDEEIPISHCGIVVRQKDQWMVVHSLSRTVAPRDGVQQCSLEDFLADAKKGSFYLVRPLEKTRGEATAREALRLLEKACPFDYSFDLQDSSAMYCLELVRHCLKSAGGPDLFALEKGRKNNHLRMGILLDARYFQKI